MRVRVRVHVRELGELKKWLGRLFTAHLLSGSHMAFHSLLASVSALATLSSNSSDASLSLCLSLVPKWT